ncbi:MAG: glycosyltransferase, partial [Planctomycetota bacterium]
MPSPVPSASVPAERTPLAAVITELDPGGAEQAFLRVVVGLAGRGWAPHVFALRGGGLKEKFEAQGVPVTLLDGLPGADPRPLRRFLTRERPPVALSFLFHANLLTRLTARLAGRPAVVCGLRVAERRRNGHRLLDRWTAGLVDRWVCVGESVRQFSIAPPSAGGGGLPERRVATIPNGVDFERWANAAPAERSSLRIPERARALLFAGRLDEQKDPFTLLNAFARLGRDDVHLLIAGDGPLHREMAEWCRRETAGERVSLLGRRDD